MRSTACKGHDEMKKVLLDTGLENVEGLFACPHDTELY